MNLSYEILCRLLILHEFYATRLCPDLSIQPSASTTVELKNQKLLFNMAGNELILLAQTRSAGQPFLSMPTTTRLTFYVTLQNAAFLNVTNTETTLTGKTRFYWSNIAQNTVAGVQYVSTPIAQYGNGNAYAVNALASDGSGNVYEALKSSSNSAPHALADTGWWRARGAFQYANHNDQLDLSADTYVFPVTAATDFTFAVYGLNTTNGQFDQLLLSPPAQHWTTPQTTVNVPLQPLPYGKYRVQVNAASRYIYYDPAAYQANVFGIFELFNYLPAASAFSLFNTTGGMTKPDFTLRFANRGVIWRYFAATAAVLGINDSSGTYTFTGPLNNAFQSTVPILLSDTPITTLALESGSPPEPTPVGNPGYSTLQSLLQGTDTYFSADKYLNY
jgi:hypothetical protein